MGALQLSRWHIALCYMHLSLEKESTVYCTPSRPNLTMMTEFYNMMSLQTFANLCKPLQTFANLCKPLPKGQGGLVSWVSGYIQQYKLNLFFLAHFAPPKYPGSRKRKLMKYVVMFKCVSGRSLMLGLFVNIGPCITHYHMWMPTLQGIYLN